MLQHGTAVAELVERSLLEEHHWACEEAGGTSVSPSPWTSTSGQSIHVGKAVLNGEPAEKRLAQRL